MKLLSQNEAQNTAKRERDAVINETARLREYAKRYRKLVDSMGGDLDSKKVQDLKEFESFIKEIQAKKSRLLEELATIETQIEIKKEAYYSLIEKQDELDERLYQLVEREKKLDLRENFIKSIEDKQNGL